LSGVHALVARFITLPSCPNVQEHIMSWDSEDTRFNVVRNHEEQYSIWPTYKDIPAGWEAVGVEGTKADCLAHIEKVWVDMRPLSLRRALEAQGTAGAA
jgi:MbtH protein